MPYGTKDKDTIIRYSLEALEFLEKKEIDILIIACNSASAYALETLQKNTSIPVIGVIDSGILAVNSHIKNKNSNILVIGTPATIHSNLYNMGLQKNNFINIISKATPLLVPLVEENILEGEVLNSILNYYFQDLINIDVVILGCTHFPLLENQISKYFNNAITIHSGDAIVEYLTKEFNFIKKYQNTKIDFFASSNLDGLKQVASTWL